MMRLIFCLMFFVSHLVVAAQVKTTALGKAGIPQEIKYNGDLSAAFQWTDKEGKHILLATTALQTDGEAQSASLYASHYISDGPSYKQVWKLTDGVQDCQLDLTASFLTKALLVTDLDKDGKAELWLMYKTACRGDLSPATMKLIMYEGEQKYACRGTTRVQAGSKSYSGGEFKFDAAFTNGPTAFSNYARQLWQKFKAESWD